MKFICLGYIEDGAWEKMSPAERSAMMEQCLAYDVVLRESGHFAGGEALEGPRTAATVRWRGGKVAVTDGPYAETKEQIGGILILEANDMQHAIELMSKHPAVRLGTHFEIRPAAEAMNELIEERVLAAKP